MQEAAMSELKIPTQGDTTASTRRVVRCVFEPALNRTVRYVELDECLKLERENALLRERVAELEEKRDRAQWVFKESIDALKEAHHERVAELERMLKPARDLLYDYSKILYDSIEYGPDSTRCISVKRWVAAIDAAMREASPPANG